MKGEIMNKNFLIEIDGKKIEVPITDDVSSELKEEFKKYFEIAYFFSEYKKSLLKEKISANFEEYAGFTFIVKDGPYFKQSKYFLEAYIELIKEVENVGEVVI